MKYKHPIVIHVPDKATFDEAKITDDATVAETLKDGSCILTISVDDPLWRFRLPDYVPGCTVFPHPLSSRPLDSKHIAILQHHGVTKDDSMETALIKADARHDHYHYHPDRLA